MNAIARFFRAIKPIVWSHHPLCEEYKDHTLRILGKDICIGCFVGYTSAIIFLLIGSLTGLFSTLTQQLLWRYGWLFSAGFLFSLFRLTKYKPLKIFSKILIGMGLAFFLVAIWVYPWIIGVKILAIFLFLQMTFIIINLVRALDMYHTCKKCAFKADWDHCPGMGIIMQNLNKLHENPEESEKE